MKKFTIVFLILLTSIFAKAQDGLYGIVKTWEKTNLVSVFNSDYNERLFVGDFLCSKVSKGQKITAGHYNFVDSLNTKVYGELFIYDEGETVLYEFYVDKIMYSDGRNYSMQRFTKPTH